MGHTFEQVRAKIDVLDGGEFQVLAQRYACKKFHLKDPSYFGTSSGTTKPAKGAFDSFYRTQNGEWIALVCGHYLKDRNRTKRKIFEDVNKVRDEEKKEDITLFRIICCHSCSRFSPQDIEELEAADDRVVVLGPDEIAEDICEKYFFLATQYLGLASGGVFLDVEEFLQLKENDVFEASLSTELKGREYELEILLSLIKENQAVIVTGRSGCGKTRLAVEAAIQYADQHEKTDLYCIKAGRFPLGEELFTYFSRPGDILILVDDVNELADIASLVEHALLHPNIRFLLTVRDYALGTVRREIKRIEKLAELSITQLENGIICDVLLKSYKIRSYTVANALTAMAKGNLRVAFLAAERLQFEDLEFVNYEKLLDICYGKELDKMPEMLQKVGEISAILGPHKTEHNKDLTTLESQYGLAHVDYIKACTQLFDRELLDMRQNYAAVSLEEQNLRDYFMYRSIVVSQYVSLTTLWSLENGKCICKRVINTLFGVFNDDRLKARAEQFANETWPGLQDSERYDFLIQYGLFLGAKGLIYLQRQIEELPNININVSEEEFFGSAEYRVNNGIIAAISIYLKGDNYREALQLMFEYMDKGSVKIKEAERFFSSAVILSPDSRISSYKDRLFILNQLSARCKGNKNAFYSFCLKTYVKAIWNDELLGEVEKEGAVLIAHGNMSASLLELIQLRKKCAEELSCISPQHACLTILSYRSCSRFGMNKNTIRETCFLIDELIQPCRNWTMQEVINGVRLKQYAAKNHIVMNRLVEKLKSSWGVVVIDLFLQPDMSKYPASKQKKTNLEKLAKAASRDNLKDLIELLARGEWANCRGAWNLQRNLSELFLQIAIREREKAEIFCDLYLGARLKANQIAFAISEFLLDQKGYRATKNLLIDASLSDLGEWLSHLDNAALEAGKFEASQDEVMLYVREYGERFLAEQVLMLDELYHGFYFEYLVFLLSSEDGENIACFANIPETRIQTYQALLQRDERLIPLFEKVFVQRIEQGVGVLFNGFARLLVSFDGSFNKALFLAVCSSADSLEYEKEFFGFVWKQTSCKRTITGIVDALLKEDTHLMYGAWTSLGKMLNSGEENVEDQFIIEQALGVLKEKGIDIFIDVACCLSNSLKKMLLLELARNGEEWQVLEKVFLTPPGHFETWSKSYIPLIDKRIKFINETRELFHLNSLFQYDIDFLRIINRQEQQALEVQLDEFVDPFYRSEA